MVEKVLDIFGTDSVSEVSAERCGGHRWGACGDVAAVLGGRVGRQGVFVE